MTMNPADLINCFPEACKRDIVLVKCYIWIVYCEDIKNNKIDESIKDRLDWLY